MEQNLPKPIDKNKNNDKKNAIMAFYKEKEHQYTETDMLGVSLTVFCRQGIVYNSMMWQSGL